MGRGEGGKIGRDSGVRKSATGGGGGGAPMKHRQTETERDRDRKRQRQTHTEGERHRERQRQRGGSGKQTDGVTRLTPQDSGSAKSDDVTKQKLHKHSVRYLFLLAKPLLDGKMVGKGDSFPITAEILTEKFSCNNSITIKKKKIGVGGRGGLSAKLPKFVKLP